MKPPSSAGDSSALILIFLVANPLLQLVKESLTNAKTGDYTFANYVAAFALRKHEEFRS